MMYPCRVPLVLVGELADDVYCRPCGGKCCRHMIRPPFLHMSANTKHGKEKWWADVLADTERFSAAPEGARKAVESAPAEYHEGMPPEDMACVWLGQDGRCRHYEFRPAICREFPPASPDCLFVSIPWCDTPQRLTNPTLLKLPEGVFVTAGHQTPEDSAVSSSSGVGDVSV